MTRKRRIRVILGSLLSCSFLIIGLYGTSGSQSPQRIERGGEITTSHEGFILSSNFTRDHETKINTIIYRVATGRELTATVHWLSAMARIFKLTPEDREKESFYQYGSWVRPKTHDAANLPGLDYSVIVYSEDISDGEIRFSAPAHVPVSRVIWKWTEVVLEQMAEPIIRLISELKSLNIRVEFYSVVRKITGNPNEFEYRYLVRNLSDKKIYFQWTSALSHELPNGWYGRLEPKKGATLEESMAMGYQDYLEITFQGGPPIEIIDLAVFNTENEELLPSLENLGLQGDLKDRIIGDFDDVAETVGLKDLPPDDINIIAMAPAFISPEWIQESQR